jgi:tetratricopeptide (TPR) repeat protein
MIDAIQQRIAALEKKVGPQAHSPLFAQLAYLYLEAKRSRDALRICDAGLAQFPFYTTGHFIKGKALLALNMNAEARREFEFVLDFLPSNETISGLISQIPSRGEVSIAPDQQKAPPRVAAPEPPEAPPPPPATPPPAPMPEPAQPAAVSEGSPFFGTVEQATPVIPTEEPFGPIQTGREPETPAMPQAAPFGDFGLPTQETTPPSETLQPPVEQPAGFDFGTASSDLNIPISLTQAEEEPFEHFAERRRPELSGEETISLDDYLANKIPAQPSESAPPPELAPSLDLTPPSELATPSELTSPSEHEPPVSFGQQDSIEELTQKLQGVERITPVIDFAQKETPTVSEQDTPAGMGFVTPTLAEIYAKQGWFDDAIKAYKTLARSKPGERERFEKRIAELEDLKKQQSGG